MDLDAVDLGVLGRGAAEVGESREHPQWTPRPRWGSGRGSSSSSSSLWSRVIHQRAHGAAVGRLGAVVAGGHQQEEAHDDLVLLEFLAIDLGMDEHTGQVFGWGVTTVLDQLLGSARRSGARPRCITVSMPSGLRSGSPKPEHHGVHQRGPRFVVLGGMPMKLPITRETTGCATSPTRSQRSRVRRAGRARRR